MSVFHVACTICLVSQYSPGVMQEVVANRGIVESPDGYVAVRDCEFIGMNAWLRPLGQAQWEHFVVADCSMPPGTDGAYEWMTRNMIVAEIDYQTAARWDVVGRMARAQIKTSNAETMTK